MNRNPAVGSAAPGLGWLSSPDFGSTRLAMFDRVRGSAPGRGSATGPGAGALPRDPARTGPAGVGIEAAAAVSAIPEQPRIEAVGP